MIIKVEHFIPDGQAEDQSSRLRTANYPSLSPMGHAYCCLKSLAVTEGFLTTQVQPYF